MAPYGGVRTARPSDEAGFVRIPAQPHNVRMKRYPALLDQHALERASEIARAPELSRFNL
jgi:hypothetical protein